MRPALKGGKPKRPRCKISTLEVNHKQKDAGSTWTQRGSTLAIVCAHFTSFLSNNTAPKFLSTFLIFLFRRNKTKSPAYIKYLPPFGALTSLKTAFK